MNLKYYLTKEDHLTFQLYASSQSKRIRSKRLKMWFIVPILYVIIGLLLFYLKDIKMLIIFFAVALLWAGFYPLYSRWLYKRHYKKYIEENYASQIGKDSHITVEGEWLLTHDESSEGKIKITEIETISEIKTHFFLKLKKGVSIIIPKVRFNEDELKAFIDELIKVAGLSLIDKTDWKWR